MDSDRRHINNLNVTWSDTAASYANNIAKVSSLAAAHVVQMALDMKSIDNSSTVLDIGTGTGVVIDVINSKASHVPILATDSSPAMLAVVEAKQLANVATRVVDANSLTEKLDGQKFTHVFGTFVLQFMKNCLSTVEQIHDIIEPGGIAALSIWRNKNSLFLIWKKACQSIDPSYEMPQPAEDPNCPWKVSELAAMFEEAGFSDLHAVSMTFPLQLKTEDYCKYWFESNSPAAKVFTDTWHGDMSAVRSRVEEIVRNEYNDGQNLEMPAVMLVARKTSK